MSFFGRAAMAFKALRVGTIDQWRAPSGRTVEDFLQDQRTDRFHPNLDPNGITFEIVHFPSNNHYEIRISPIKPRSDSYLDRVGAFPIPQNFPEEYILRLIDTVERDVRLNGSDPRFNGESLANRRVVPAVVQDKILPMIFRGINIANRRTAVSQSRSVSGMA